ncbi:MAG: DUF7523 family protein, partial [Halobacteriota archaeon]
MTVAAETRAAVRNIPFLFAGLRAGLLNYTAAAEYLDVDGETEAVAAALRRFAEDLPPVEPDPNDVTVRMQRGVGTTTGDASNALVSVHGVSIAPDAGDDTALVVTGDVTPALVGEALLGLRTASIDVLAAGVADGAAIVVVEGRSAVDAGRRHRNPPAR